jgi:hypothetical protein
VASVLSTVGAPSTTASTFQSDLAKVNSIVPGISALGAGQWVSVSKASLQPLLGILKTYQGGATTGSAASNPSKYLGVASKVVSDLKTAFVNNSTDVSNGNVNGRDEYTLTLNVQPFLQQAVAALQNDLGSLPGYSRASGNIGKIEGKIPAGQTVAVQLFVKNGRTDEIDLDIKQFDPKLPFAVPVRFQFGQNVTITAPSNATALDLSKLPSLFGNLFNGLGAASH